MSELGKATKLGTPTCPWCGTETDEAHLEGGINRVAMFQRWYWTCGGCGYDVQAKVRHQRDRAEAGSE